MFTVLQLVGLLLIAAGAAVLGGVGGAVIGVGIAAAYVGLAGDR